MKKEYDFLAFLIIILISFFTFSKVVFANVLAYCDPNNGGTNDKCDTNTCFASKNFPTFDDYVNSWLDSKDKTDICSEAHRNYVCAKSPEAETSGYSYISTEGISKDFISMDNCAKNCDKCYMDECQKVVDAYCADAINDQCSAYNDTIASEFTSYSNSVFSDCSFVTISTGKEGWASLPPNLKYTDSSYFCGEQTNEYSDGGFKETIKNSDYCRNNDCSDSFYDCAVNYCKKNFDNQKYNNCKEITTDQYQSIWKDKSLTASGTMISINKLGTISCSSIKEIVNFFDGVYVFIEVIGALLLIVMTLLNFMKVVASDKADDEMKKAKKNFVTRIIIMGIIFLLPIIVKLLINAVGGSTCYIG